MGDKKQILLVSSNRAETNLLEPLYMRLVKSPKFHVDFVGIHQHDPLYVTLKEAVALLDNLKPDLTIIPTDRLEMLPVLTACISKRIRVAHFEAGYNFTGGTWDDAVRWAISMWADIVFCNSRNNYERVNAVFRWLGKKAAVYHVGSTALDTPIVYGKDAIPKEPYDIVIYHPPTLHPESMDAELKEIESLLDKLTIWISPNGDEGSDYILKRRKALAKKHKIIETTGYDKPEFLGLLSKASRLIGNSSCLFNEAPTLGVLTIPIGIRNSQRRKIKIWGGASERITRILEEIL